MTIAQHSDWQTMKSAPKNKALLAWEPVTRDRRSGCHIIVCWLEEFDMKKGWYDGQRLAKPIAWQRLPEPPQ